MARKKKITSKNSNFVNINLAKNVDGVANERPSSSGFVKWGSNNDYPLRLLELYANSPTHHAAINFAVQSIVGNGVDYDAMKMDGNQTVPNQSYSWDELIKNIAMDYIIYGSYAVQIIKNNDGVTYSFYHLPFDRVRSGEYDEDGHINSYFISSDWSKISQNPPIEIEAFSTSKNIKKGIPYLFVYQTYSPTNDYYSSPNYLAGIKAIQSEIEFLNFDLKSAINSFTPSGMLVLNEVETDEQRQAIVDNVSRLFTGAENANSVMISFRNNVEEQSPQFIPFQTSDSSFNIFENANQRNINRILASHQIPNASLVGMPDVNGSGFASEADKLEVAYELYNKLTGNSNRMAVIKTLNMFFQMQGIDVEVKMKKLSFNDFEDDADVPERTTANISENDIEKQIEE